MIRIAGAVLLLLALTGCYVATVETGLKPSNVQIKQPFAACWIYGLIPPKTVEAASKCPNGVASVETQLSFVNMLVGWITFGIFTPMQIIVTCAEPGGMGDAQTEYDIILCESPSEEEINEAFTEAADLSKDLGRPVFVKFAESEIEAAVEEAVTY